MKTFLVSETSPRARGSVILLSVGAALTLTVEVASPGAGIFVGAGLSFAVLCWTVAAYASPPVARVTDSRVLAPVIGALFAATMIAPELREVTVCAMIIALSLAKARPSS